jgi:AGZA family xanthine/uracil permease-like MFS transporter
MGTWIERRFGLRAHGVTIGSELRAGAVTFLTMCYIVFVQPAVLSQHAGMDFGAVMAATCLSAALATLLMGLLANYPIAQAPLMGENFFFAVTVVGLLGIPWPTALGIVFLSGLAFLLLTVLRVRQLILDAVPASLTHGIAGGIGVFVAFIGLTEGGLVAKHPAPTAFVRIGDLGSPVALTCLAGLLVTAVLLARRVRGAMLLGLLASAAIGAALGVVRVGDIVAAPSSLAPTWLRLDIAGALRHLDLVLVFLFMLVFDTVGTLLGVAGQAGLLADGRLPRADRAMLSDAVGTLAGALLGTSTVSSYIESSAGVADGARTGLANVATAALFLAALFLAPLASAVGGGVLIDGFAYYPVTAPAVILVGSFMLAPLARVAWGDPTEGVPAFLTLVAMPFTFNIAHGVAAGVVAHVALKAGAGRAREVSPLMWGLAGLVVVAYVMLPSLRH